MVAEQENETIGYAASLRFHQRPVCPIGHDQYLHSPDHLGQGIGAMVYSALLENLTKEEDVHRAYGLVVCPIWVRATPSEAGIQEAGLLHEGGYKFEIPRCRVRTPPGERSRFCQLN